MRHASLLLSLIAICSIQTEARADASQKHFEQAQLSLKKGSYKQAEIELRESISERPNVALSHYYLANTLVHLQRHDEAIDEFRRAYRLDPYGLTSGYCRQALDKYGQRMASAPKPGVDDKAHSASVATIKMQAEREKQRHQNFADSLARSASVAGDFQVRKIRAYEKEEVDRIMNAPGSALPGSQALSAERAASVRRNAEEMEVIAKDMTVKRSQQYAQWSQEKSALLDETVDNLQNQLSTKSLPGSAKLNEKGTDLFVRNYGQVSTSVAPKSASVRVSNDDSNMENRSANVTVSESESVVKRPDELRSVPAAKNNHLPITSRTVHGQIVPPM